MLQGSDPCMARRALAVWGLTADDIGVLSIHGTSAGANVCEVGLHIDVLSELEVIGCRRQTSTDEANIAQHTWTRICIIT